MAKRTIIMAAFALFVGAAVFLMTKNQPAGKLRPARPGFVQTAGARFVIDGQPFRFIGANVAVMYRDEDRERMPETLLQAAQNGLSVIRVWASGEGGTNDVKPMADFRDWPRTHPFRWSPDEWNEEAFVHLDHVLAEAARQHLRVQLTLCNWWRDTGGVTQYLRWANINDAADDRQPFGINVERAMLFYTNEETRRLYREHVEKVVMRRNTVTGVLYRDDPTIMGYELMNEAQAPTGRTAERRAWIEEMSAYIKSLDPDHLVAPGIWGYRNSFERREWLLEHALPNIDYCDVHNYPRDDRDLFIESPDDLRDFIDNRSAAALSINKPLVFGEFGMAPEGFKEIPEETWFRAFFESTAQAGVGGAMFWIWTPDPQRGYGVSYTTERDSNLRREIARAAQLFASLQGADPPRRLLNAGQHLIPRQFAFMRSASDPTTFPEMSEQPDGALLYRFSPEQAATARFEKLGGGEGYIWGSGAGFVEYLVPITSRPRSIGRLTVRAHLQPVLPHDANGRFNTTQVTLFVNGVDCGSRLIPKEEARQPFIQEWQVNSIAVRLRSRRNQPISLRLAVKVDAQQPFGLNISNWPEGYDAHGAKPVEVELR